MPQRLATVPKASHRESLASVRPQMAKADLPGQVEASELPELTLTAIRKGHGKVAVAADVLDMHEASLGRLAKEGELKLKHLRSLGRPTLAEFGKQLVDTYGPMADSPEQQASRLLDVAQDAINELRQYVQQRRTA